MLSHILQAIDWEATEISYKNLCGLRQNINHYSLPEIVHNYHSGMKLCWRQYNICIMFRTLIPAGSKENK
jgi:hypothetical protein